jgi:membrane associated rhomboid family serine protease
MSQKPAVAPDFLQSVKAWLDAHNWAYWACAIGGLVGLAVVAIIMWRRSRPAEAKA